MVRVGDGAQRYSQLGLDVCDGGGDIHGARRNLGHDIEGVDEA